MKPSSIKKISVVVPAHNEEKYIRHCLESIKIAATKITIPVEIVVSLNRCSDNTETIANQYNVVITRENDKNIAKIRNRGIETASGDLIITIDADSWMSANMLTEVITMMDSLHYIGGGVRIKLERLSIGIIFSLLTLIPYLLTKRISAGMFWFKKQDFITIGGFDENYISAEDYQFGLKLKAYGKTRGLKFGTIKKQYIITSCRKFDQFGDWYLFKNPRLVKQIFSGTNSKAANGFYYDIGR